MYSKGVHVGLSICLVVLQSIFAPMPTALAHADSTFHNVAIFRPPPPHTLIIEVENLGNETGLVALQSSSTQLIIEIPVGGTSFVDAVQFLADQDRIGLVTVQSNVSTRVQTYSTYTRDRFVYAGLDGDTFGPSPYGPFLPPSDGAATLLSEVYSLTVTVGDTVTWVRAAGIHNVVADDGSFSSGAPSDEWTFFSHTFTTPGTVRYYCQAHGSINGHGMAGVIHVVAAEDPDPDPRKIFLPVLFSARI